LALGQFLTPAFVMSLSGGVASLLLLALAMRLPARWFGPIGLSVLAAFAHIGAQLWVVDAWLLPGASILGLMPLFLSAAWITGLVNGFAADHLLHIRESKP